MVSGYLLKGGDKMVSEDTRMGRDMDNFYAWRRKNIKRTTFDLNLETDKDVVDWLYKQPNIRKYLIELIREDMRRENGQREEFKGSSRND